MLRLTPEALRSIPAMVRRPAYPRDRLRSGIVHLGPGAFMRAHLAAMTDDALDAGAALDWGITGVSLRHADARDASIPQAGLYTLALRDTAGTSHRILGCFRECLVAPEDPDAVLSRLADAAIRVVSLTVTEKGYHRDPASGALLVGHDDIAHDLTHPQTPRTAIGFIVHGLARRRALARGPVTLMSLDNLPANGRWLCSLVLDFADRVDGGLARWIEDTCTFPSSMVDRIVPRCTDVDRRDVASAIGFDDAWPAVAEPFIDWAVEDRFAAGRPDWSAGGARFVDDASPWERLKLRMVNGAHSTIAYLAVGAGWATVDAAIAQPALRRHVQALLSDEVAPTLGPLPGLDLAAYRQRLIERFANPALAHSTLQIAMDGSQKLPQRLLDTIRDRLRVGAGIERLSLGVAAWLHFLRGRDDRGRVVPIDDPLAEALRTWHQRADAIADPGQRARSLTGFAPVFGDLAEAPPLVDALAPHLQSLRDRGVSATLAATG